MGMFYKTLDFISRCFFKVLILVDAIVFHTYVCYNNGRKLVHFLIHGTRTWVVMAARLLMFTVLLAPGWYKLLRYWFLSPLIIRNLRYGKGAKNRNLLDVYLPVPQQKHSKAKGMEDNTNYNNSFSRKNGAPVVIFVSGGAWTIGYKMWSALVARGLARLGILTIVPDYRNFPQGDIEDMMEDVRLSVEWTVCNAHRFGGDSNKIVLSGQSAGAHITLCLLVADYIRSQQQTAENSKQEAAEGRSKRSTAERFLAATDDSGSEIYEEDDDSDSEINDYEEEEEEEEDAILSELDHPEAHPSAPHVHSESLLNVEMAQLPQEVQHPGVTDATATTDSVLSPLSSLCSPDTIEYFTPLKTGTSGAGSARATRRTFSPRPATTTSAAPDTANGTTSVEPSSGASATSVPINTVTLNTGSSGKVRRSSYRQLHARSVEVMDDSGVLYSPTSDSIRRKRAHSSGSLIASDSKSAHKHHCGGSIIDLIDTYLGANISSNNHRGPGVQLLSATAASLKKKFREQLRRNSSPGEDALTRFDSESSSNEEQLRSTPMWKEVDSDTSPAVSPKRSPRTVNSSRLTPKNSRIHMLGHGQPERLTPSSVQPAPTSAVLSSRMSSMSSELPAELIPGAITVTETDPAQFASPPVQTHTSAGATLFGMNRHYSPRRVASKHQQKKRKPKFCVASNIKLFIGVSGPYNLTALESHLHQRGLDVSILNWICRGNIANYSPTTQLEEYAHYLVKLAREEHGMPASPVPHSTSNPSSALRNLTPIALFHGSRDASIPVSICTELSDVLQSHGANVLCKIYEGWSHTDAILEAPLSGTMRLFHDMAGVIFAHTADCSSNLGSTNSISGLSGPVDRLVIPPSTQPQENDTYICSPLDYLSIILFPKLFSSTAPAQVISSESTRSALSASTAEHTTAGAAGPQSDSDARGNLAGKAAGTSVNGAKKSKRKQTKGGSGGEPMVSQLLVKIAREINPF